MAKLRTTLPLLISYIQERNIQLPGVEPFTTIESVQRRFLDIGFSGARALTLKDIRRDFISEKELERYGHALDITFLV